MRNVLAATAVLAFSVAAHAQEPIKLRVAGNLLATGLIQQNKEQPFFENLAKKSGLPLDVDYKPMDVVGIKDAEGLRVLKSGLFDVVTLRIAQVSRDEPFLLGADLVGLNPNYDVARKVVDAYREAFDKRLQERFNGKLLGIWPFGPQVLFCNATIGSLADLKGKKVRVYDQSLAKFIEQIGGIPVSISFGETQQSLQRGVVDCAITGPSSANSAGWPEVTTHFMPIGFQIALNAYAMNLNSWKKLTPEQQGKLTAAFDELERDTWAYSKELFDDAVRCNVGKEPCTTVKKFKMTEVPVKEADLKTVQDAIAAVSLPAWSEVCNKSYAGCSDAWKKLLGPITGVK
ncbi:ABC transporter substrate-binding protein [Bosea sp. LC85]|uniref:TRAP transporter substrate-binding protein n=1 Tax=Bosea sp. LC85 TaxID=1502851 RepID=UPI0004E2AFE7|nr:TRAP transporter substrate-binding protein [Bosea sp. LC85]KFC73090.1 ABC transporter substrate-binding protein [Bosea sp. LC85]